MSSKQSKSRQAANIDLRKFRSAVAKLKQKGLLSPKIDARSQKPTRYMTRQVKSFADVLSGKAAVVKVPKAAREQYAKEGGFRTKRGRVIVPIENKKERVRYDAKSQRIVTTREAFGKRIKKRIIPKNQPLPEGDKLRYTIPFGSKGRYTFPNLDELRLFMAGYSRYQGWEKYVEVEEIEGDNDDADMEDAA